MAAFFYISTPQFLLKPFRDKCRFWFLLCFVLLSCDFPMKLSTSEDNDCQHAEVWLSEQVQTARCQNTCFQKYYNWTYRRLLLMFLWKWICVESKWDCTNLTFVGCKVRKHLLSKKNMKARLRLYQGEYRQRPKLEICYTLWNSWKKGVCQTFLRLMAEKESSYFS